MYLGLVASCGETRDLIDGELYPGTTYQENKALKLTLQVVDRCRGRLCGSMIVRMDAGFPEPGLLVGLEKRSVPYYRPHPRDLRRRLRGLPGRLGLLPGPAGTEAVETLHLLAEKVVELGWVERVSVMTVQRTLKKPTAASSEEVLASPAPGQCRIRSLHGGRIGRLCPSLRPPSTGRVHG